MPARIVRPILHRDRLEQLAGNNLVPSTASGGFILLAHLHHGSLPLGPVDNVRTGQLVGQVGNVGNSVGPHLHNQLMDGPDPFTSQVTSLNLSWFLSLRGKTWDLHGDAPLPDRATRVRFTLSGVPLRPRVAFQLGRGARHDP